MGFGAKFSDNTTGKNFENRPTLVEVMNECIVAQFFLTHGVYYFMCLHRSDAAAVHLRNGRKRSDTPHKRFISFHIVLATNH